MSDCVLESGDPYLRSRSFPRDRLKKAAFVITSVRHPQGAAIGVLFAYNPVYSPIAVLESDAALLLARAWAASAPAPSGSPASPAVVVVGASIVPLLRRGRLMRFRPRAGKY